MTIHAGQVLRASVHHSKLCTARVVWGLLTNQYSDPLGFRGAAGSMDAGNQNQDIIYTRIGAVPLGLAPGRLNRFFIEVIIGL